MATTEHLETTERADDPVDSETASPRMPAVRNTLAVLRKLAQSTRPVAAGALARSLDIPRSSMYQLLQVLMDEGMVTHLPESRSYTLGVGVFELGSAYLRHEPLENLARPLLVKLSRTIGETAQLGILHGSSTLYLVKERPARGATVVTDVGVRLPAHLTASGRSMLAGLPESEVAAYFSTRSSFMTMNGTGPKSLRELRVILTEDAARGWSMEKGSVTEGITCIAAPAHDRFGRPAASVVTSFLTDRRADDVDMLSREIVRAADELTRRLGGVPARGLPAVALVHDAGR